MAVRITSKDLSDGTILFLVPFFFVHLSNSFEQVPVPAVNEKPYGPNSRTLGMAMRRSEFSTMTLHSGFCWTRSDF